MRTLPRAAAVIVAVFLGYGLLVKGADDQSGINVWAASAPLSGVRDLATAVPLPDGRVLLTGGLRDDGRAVASAELFDAVTGSSPAAPMHVARARHGAVVLLDGRVLVAGGVMPDGSATDLLEIYDPGADVWTVVGSMAEPRAGLTASLLGDGRVLIAGGESGGYVTSSVEVFDPVTRSSAPGVAMSAPRVGHAAATLPDGRVLLAGGSDGTTPLSSVDLYDAASATIVQSVSLSEPRAGLTATALLDGNVLVAGGTNGSTELSSAEIYDAASGTFIPTGPLASRRRDHRALLLPHNNNVLIVGGTAGGAGVATAEVFASWTGTFTLTGSPSAARVGSTATALSSRALVLLAGGSAVATTEMYAFATLETDRDDYAPGERVTITGSGWQPGEQVTLDLREVPPLDDHPSLTAIADASGHITNTDFTPDARDAGVRFYVTARGAASQAQVTFTDSPKVGSVSVGAQTGTVPTYGAAGSATYSVTVTRGSGGGSSGAFVAALSVTTGLPSGASASFVPSSLSFTPTDTSLQSTLTITTTATAPAVSSRSFTIRAGTSVDDFATTNGTLTVNKRAITVTAVPNTKVYDGTTAAAAVPTITSGTLAANDTATFTETYDTKHFGTGKVLTPAGVVSDGASGANYAITFAPSAGGVISTRAITVTAADNTKPYDGTTSAAATPTVTVGSVATGDTATLTETYDTRHVGSGKTLTPTGSINDGNGGANYVITFATAATGTITVRAITVTAASNTKVYDGTTSATATPTITSGALAPGDTATLTESYDTKHVGSGKTLTPTGSIADGNNGANYAVTFAASVTGTITAAPVTVTAVANTRGYDGTTTAAAIPQMTSGSLASGDSANFSETYDTKHVGSGKTLTPAGSVNDGNSGANYAVKLVAVTTGVITQRAITVTAADNTKEYDGTTGAAATPSITVGSLASGDSATLSETYDTKHAGVGKTLTPAAVVDDGNGGANYAATLLPVTTGTITARPITVTATSVVKQYDGTTSAQALPAITTGTLATGDAAGFTETFDTKHVGSAKTLTPGGSVSDGNGGGNYSIAFVAVATGAITARAITVTAVTETKEYDGTTHAAALPAVTDGSVVTGDAPAFVESYDSKNAGTHKTLTPSGSVSDGNGGSNYIVSFVPCAGVITARAITVTATANSKEYDGNTTAVATPAISSGSLADGDTAGFTETYGTKNVGTAKPLTPAGVVADGSGGANYAVTFVAANSGTITPRSITVTATPNQKEYDGTTAAAATPSITAGTLASGDLATFSEVYDSKHVGTGKVLTPSGSISDGADGSNYTIVFVTSATGEIAQRLLTVTASSASKQYDGSRATTAAPAVTSGTLATGDTAEFVEAFDTRHVGAGKTLTPAGTIHDGNGGGNYAVTFVSDTTGSITPRAMTVTAASNAKIYDGTTSALASPTITVGSLASGDTGEFVETYDNKHAGSGKLLTPAGSVADGNGGGNYVITFVSATVGDIAVRPLTVTASPDLKTYDGTTSAAALPAITSGSLAFGDSAVFTESYDTRHVGSGKILTPSGVITDGHGGADYSLVLLPSATGTITARALTVTATTNTKEYDGTTAAAAIPQITDGSLAPGDAATFTETYDTADVGTGKLLIPAGTVTDGNGGADYAVTFASTSNGEITRLDISVTSPSDFIYDLNSRLVAAYTCPGAASCVGDVPNGALLDTSSPGLKSFTVNATDANGNTNTTIVTYAVSLGACVLPLHGLTAWLPGDASADDWVTRAPATWSGTEAYAQGRVGQAFAVGAGSAAFPLQQAGAFTLQAWLLTADRLQPEFSGVISSGDQTQRPTSFQIDLDGSGNYRLTAGSGDLSWLIGPASPVFQHLAVTFDGSTIAVYLNGQLVQRDAWTGSPSIGFHTLKLGIDREGTHPFNGLVDEVQVFDRALSDAEVLESFLTGSAGTCKDRPPVAVATASTPAEATGPTGGPVVLDGSGSNDPDQDVLTFTWREGSTLLGTGSVLPTTFTLGSHTVTLTVDDGRGMSDASDITVVVRDTTAPALTVPSIVDAEATSAAGALVIWTSSATDTVDGIVGVTCVPASGSQFAVGATPVICSATDAHGNTGTATVTVTVHDTTSPTLTLPTAVVAEATSSLGTPVVYSPTAGDSVDGAVPVECVPASGSGFGLGETLVTCHATDAHHNTATGTFPVIVHDTTAPTLAVTSPSTDALITSSTVDLDVQAVDAIGVAGVTVNGIAATRTGGSSLSGTWHVTVPVTLPVAPGGALTFEVRASDAAGNTGAGLFVIDNDGIAAAMDRSRASGVDTSGAYSDDFNNGVTAGTVTRNGWTVKLSNAPTPGGVHATIAGSGTIAHVSACVGLAKDVRLDVVGETADITCDPVTGTITVKAVSAVPFIELREQLTPTIWQQFSLRTGQSMSVGSPARASAENRNPIHVQLLQIDQNGAEQVVGTYQLEPDATVDVTVTSNGSGRDNLHVNVLRGRASLTIGGAQRTLRPGAPAMFATR